MTATTRHIDLVFGGYIFGQGGGSRVNDPKEAQEMLDAYFNGYDGLKIIDTSRAYGYGTSEQILGQVDTRGAVIDTKAWLDKSGPEPLSKHIRDSIKALNGKKIRIFYFHLPERTVPIEEHLKMVNQLHNEGLFEEFGLSNFPSWEVAEIYHICKAKGWILPTVYQGVYNLLRRNIEYELFPCLKKYEIRFYGYSPLNGGLLTGALLDKSDFDRADRKGTRWDTTSEGASPFAQMQRDQGVPYMPIVRDLKEYVEKHGLTLPEVSIRWLKHHSPLKDQDGVVFGCGKLQHIPPLLQDWKKGPLPDDVVEAVEQAWNKSKGIAPHYFF